jgi:hypothetical protein
VVTSDVVPTWYPSDAICLQRALRLTNEAFAETLGAAPRTVAKWHANPGMSLTVDMQAALDTLLSRASEDAHARFGQLRDERDSAQDAADFQRITKNLNEACHLHSSLAWMDDVRDAEPGTTFAAVVEAAMTQPALTLPQQALGRERRALSQLMLDYYSSESGVRGGAWLATSEGRLETSLLTQGLWLGSGVDLLAAAPRFELARSEAAPLPEPTPALLSAVHARLAQCLNGGTRYSDQPTYRLLACEPCADGVHATFGLSTFARYALSWDLLETEALKAVAAGQSRLELRDQLLPSLDQVRKPAERECVGGALALTAFARAPRGGRSADYALLIQERSSRVLNGTGRVAVVPKCFHQPTNEPPAEVGIGTTLLRELEEELFGREEVDSSIGTSPVADLLHWSRLTEPMHWLVNSSSFDMQLTGFAYNLLAGSFEFPALIAVHDEEFWNRFGGDIEANWESSGLSRCSSADPDAIEELLHDPRWSDEGLVAFALGLKRLAQLDPERVRLPAFEIGVTS